MPHHTPESKARVTASQTEVKMPQLPWPSGASSLLAGLAPGPLHQPGLHLHQLPRSPRHWVQPGPSAVLGSQVKMISLLVALC